MYVAGLVMKGTECIHHQELHTPPPHHKEHTRHINLPVTPS